MAKRGFVLNQQRFCVRSHWSSQILYLCEILDSPMLPYITIPPIEIGPVTIYPFGLILATGVLVGWKVCDVYRRRHGMDVATMNSLLWRVVVVGFITAHLSDVFLY